MAVTIARKRWFRLAPIFFITFSLAFLDRANFSFAAASGMAEDLGITTSMSSLLSSLFFLGYFCFQIPGGIYAATKSAKKLIFWSLIGWGGLSAATGMLDNINYLVVIRFLLGVVESAVMPALLILLSRWFTKTERSLANTFLALGNPVTILWMSVLSGYLINAFGWRGMFIIEGVPAIIWAICWWKWVDNEPASAKWLSAEEKKSLEEELRKEQEAIQPVKNYAQAFKSKTVLLLCCEYLFWNLGVFGFVMWLPSIIRTAPNMSIVETGWLSAIPYVLAVAGMITASYFSDRSLNRKAFIWPFLLIGAIAIYGSYLAGANFWFSYGLLIIAGGAIYAPYGPFFASLTELIPRNVAGGAIALINSCGALGSFVGAFIVGYLNAITGDFGRSYLFMAVSLLIAASISFLGFGGRKSHTEKYALKIADQ
jgi:sugar phosphate permease